LIINHVSSKNDKIVLNKSMLSDQDVGEFSREAGGDGI